MRCRITLQQKPKAKPESNVETDSQSRIEKSNILKGVDHGKKGYGSDSGGYGQNGQNGNNRSMLIRRFPESFYTLGQNGGNELNVYGGQYGHYNRFARRRREYSTSGGREKWNRN